MSSLGQASGFVAIVGRPNVGKSTLLNAVLATDLSIVTPKAQTTRDRIFGILTDGARGQMVFVDTPGIHKAREGGINAYMVQQAEQSLEAPNAIWYLVDPSSKVEFEKEVLDRIAAHAPEAPLFVLLNKVDLKGKSIPAETFEKLEAGLREGLEARGLKPASVMELSGRSRKGLDALLSATWERMPEGPWYYPLEAGVAAEDAPLSDRPVRFFAAEQIREQLYLQLGDEIPYSCAVEIASFDESKKPLHIQAVIHVERDSQKGMVIGAKGQKVKAIGMAARQGIEKLVGEQIFLGLQVKVYKDWSREANSLKKMGYLLADGARPGGRSA